MESIKHLGTSNSWDHGVPEPLEYVAHKQAVKAGERHDVKGMTLGRCLTQYTCHTCGISWNVDSGD
jgi:hypothetical protein